MTFGQALWALYDGRSTAADFFRTTELVWPRMARYLLRRWKPPAFLDLEDIVQELRLGAMLHLWRYEPGHGKSLEEFVRWNAIDYAKKKLHAARGAKLSGNADANPSRIEVPLDPGGIADWHRVEPDQDGVAMLRESIDRLSERERLAVEAFLRAGDIVRGAVELFEDESKRRQCAVERPRDAGYLVARAVQELRARLSA